VYNRELMPEQQLKVGTASGFLLTVRMPFYKSDGEGQGGQAAGTGEVGAPPTIAGYDQELVMVLHRGSGKPLDVSKLAWPSASHTYYRQRMYLGRSEHYHWYGDMPIWGARRLMTQAKLEGGPDPIDLALKEIEIEDKGNMTANSGIYYLRDNADKAFPKLKAAIFSKGRKYPEHAIRALGGSRSKEATALLVQIYRSKNDKLRGGAGYALIHKPYRKEAKAAYLDMIKRGTYIHPAAEAAVEFGWTEAAKPLLSSLPDMHTAWQYAGVFLLGKELIGVKAPAEVQQIRFGPWTDEKVERTKTALLAWPDKEAAAVVAFSMACFATKANVDSTNRVGRDVLLKLPPDVTKKFLETVVRDLPNKEEKKVAQKLLWEIP
jgi:hypothetical protein